MDTVTATDLKNRLGPVLARAALAPVAIVRHGRVVAYLVPPTREAFAAPGRPRFFHGALDRAEEQRVVDLCASGDLRPSRWLRAGEREMLAGVAVMLASQPDFDRVRLLALAERLFPGMTAAKRFGKWLETIPVEPARFLPLVQAQMRRPA